MQTTKQRLGEQTVPQYYKDLDEGRVGECVGNDGPGRYLLRPLGGGREWVCKITGARPATTAEIVSAKLHLKNRMSTK